MDQPEPSPDETDEPIAAIEPDAPGALLDTLRDHPEWGESERDAAFDQLLRRFPAERLIGAARERLGDLDAGDGEAVLRIVEAFGSLDDFAALARAIADQPDLPPERAWEALSLLEGSGLIEGEPVLAERWEELVELVEGDDPLAALAEQIEEPDGVWVALQGLGAVEPDIRAAIIAGLADAPTRPGQLEFLRFLTFTTHPATRQAALAALEACDEDSPELLEAWATIASRHPEEPVVERARRWLGRRGEEETRSGLPQTLPAPRIVRGLVTAMDGQGLAEIALIAEDGDELAAAVFTCDVELGIRESVGLVTMDREAAETFLAESTDASSREAIEVEPALAIAMLSGSAMLSGPGAPPALPYWIERTAGPMFRPRPLPAWIEDLDPATLSNDEVERSARLVLDACPSWIDESPLTFDLAEEVVLRDGADAADPGAIRFLFERRLRDRLGSYRGMLLWMALLWRADGSDDLARAALALAGQLGDPQNAVPGHPFLAELARRSLLAAQDSLRSGHDPRRENPSGGR